MTDFVKHHFIECMAMERIPLIVVPVVLLRVLICAGRADSNPADFRMVIVGDEIVPQEKCKNH